MRRAAVVVGVLALALGSACSAWAGPITVPASGANYGDPNDSELNWGVTWGGSGIPTDHSAYRQITDNDYMIRLALRAHTRYGNSTLTPDPSKPIYYVETGKYGGAGNDKDYAKWNFDFYVAVLEEKDGKWVLADGNEDPQYRVELLYDFDPGQNTDEDDHGSIQWKYLYSAPPVANQNSWNLAMDFLSVSSSSSSSGSVTPPSGTIKTFDPNVNGEYTFALRVYAIDDQQKPGDLLGEVTMQVNAVPEPTSLVALGGLGLVGAGWRLIRRRKTQSA